MISPEAVRNHRSAFRGSYAELPEWSNGRGLGPRSLVLAKVRILYSALYIRRMYGFDKSILN